ncbi:unnamed protein product [Ixodes persulcatus]
MKSEYVGKSSFRERNTSGHTIISSETRMKTKESAKNRKEERGTPKMKSAETMTTPFRERFDPCRQNGTAER